MELIDSKDEIKNSKLLWLILGIFLIPIFNSIDSLVDGILKALGLPILPRLVFSVSFNGLIILCLFCIIVWTIKNWTVDGPHSLKLLTLKDFRRYGLIGFLLIVAGRATGFFVLTNISRELDLLSDTQKYDILQNSVNWSLTNTILTEIRELLMFSIYFVVVFKNK